MYDFFVDQPTFTDYTVSQKVLTFKLSATLSNLNRFSNFCTSGKRMKFTTKLIHYPPHDKQVATLYWEIKIQIFCR